jgi:hypothetical protein
MAMMFPAKYNDYRSGCVAYAKIGKDLGCDSVSESQPSEP